MLVLTYLYSLAAGAGLLLAGYILLAGRGRILRLRIVGVMLAAAFWALTFQFSVFPAASFGPPGLIAELLLLAAWYALIERLLRGPYLQSMPEQVRRGSRWVWGLVIVAYVVTAMPVPEIERVFPDTDVFLVGLLILGLMSLALAAQFYGEATIDQQSALKLISISAILMLGPQVLIATVVLLAQQVPEWMVTGRAVSLIVAIVLIAQAWRNDPHWSLAVFVSPQVRAYAPKLSAVTAQLVLVLLLVPVFRSLNSDVAIPSAVSFALGSYSLLFLLIFSERLRAQLRVFVSKHFLPFRYDYREEWLRLIDTLAVRDQSSEPPERAIKGIAQIVASPAGVLWLQTEPQGAYHCVAGWNTEGWDEISVESGDPAVRFMGERNWILDTAEINRRPDLYPGIQRPLWLDNFPDALLIVPLISNDGVIGFVVLFQSSSAFRLTFEEIDLLRTSGRQVAAYLAQYLADQQLSESKQFEAFNRLTAFVMHDLKNLIAQQSLMVRNAAKHKGNPEFFEDAMATIDNSVGRMNKLLTQLQSGHADRPRRAARVVDMLREAINRCEVRAPVPEFDDKDNGVEVYIDQEGFTSVLTHVIRNAQEAVKEKGAEGQVRISLDGIATQARISIKDNGCGMDPEFIRERLFRPFDSTKGSQGMGIGAYQARSFVLAAGGGFDVESAPGEGTRISIRLPVKDRAEDKPVADEAGENRV